MKKEKKKKLRYLQNNKMEKSFLEDLVLRINSFRDTSILLSMAVVEGEHYFHRENRRNEL
jgi:hypothetical protein